MLGELARSGHEVLLVVSAPDRRRSRRGAPTPTPVKSLALSLGIPVSEDPTDAPGVGAELGVIVAYGRILSSSLLASLDFVNVHFSLLPRWRGAAPVERAILAGDSSTGVCLMRPTEELDAGPVYACQTTSIGEGETAAELRGRLAVMGASLLCRRLEERGPSLGSPTPQSGEATLAPKLGREERRLDFSEPASQLARIVRVGRAWTTWRGRRLLVLSARPATAVAGGPPARPSAPPGSLLGLSVATSSGYLELVTVQPEGGAPMAAHDWVHGARPAEGEVLL